MYRRLPNVAAALEELPRSKDLQQEIWAAAVVACREANSPAVTTLVISSLNEMIDITSTRTVAAMSHPPTIIFAMTFVLILACSLFVGIELATFKRTTWPYQLVFAIILTLTAFVIMEIEFPRAGFVRLDAFDSVLVEVREDMK